MTKAGINKTEFFILLTLVAVVLAPTVRAAEDSEKAILDRIKPVGEVCIQGQECAGTTAAKVAGDAEAVADTATESTETVTDVADAATESQDSRSGEYIYKYFCSSCHGAAAVALGAPGLGDTDNWESRLAKGKDQVLNNAIKGLNVMPPKGGCMDCSDEELAAAVDYMISGGQ